MGLTNHLPSSRLAQPGVCTSTTRPATPFEGQLIFETDTNRVLVWDASAWVAPNSTTANPPGLEKITPSAVSGTGVSISGSDVILTAAPEPYITCFSSSYRHYRILLHLTAFGGGAAALTVRMASGTTANTTAANYRNVGFEAAYNAASLSTVANNGATAGWNVGRVDSSGQFSTFVMDIQNPFESTFTAYNSNFRDYGIAGVQNGFLQVTTSYDSFNPRIGGTNTMTGVIQVYGYRN